MKKRIISAVLSIVMLSGITAIPVFAYEKGISVVLDGKKIEFDVQPQIIGDRTMVPLRAIFEALGATVEWDGDTQTVTSVKGNKTIILSVGVDRITINGSSKKLDTVPCVVNDRTLVPVRAISEAFDMKVDWDGGSMTVKISSEQPSATPTPTPKPTEKPSVSATATPVANTAYDELKNAIIRYGKYDDGEYSIWYFPNDYSYGFSLGYDYEKISIFYSNSNDGSGSDLLINIKDNDSPKFLYTFTYTSGEEEKVFGILNKNREFTESSSTVPYYLKDITYETINISLRLMDLLTVQETGVSFGDLGIYYETY